MLGVVDYLRKPFAMEVMLDAVARAIAGSAGNCDLSQS
jgi:FixJ family two-component response regulator